MEGYSKLFICCLLSLSFNYFPVMANGQVENIEIEMIAQTEGSGTPPGGGAEEPAHPKQDIRNEQQLKVESALSIIGKLSDLQTEILNLKFEQKILEERILKNVDSIEKAKVAMENLREETQNAVSNTSKLNENLSEALKKIDKYVEGNILNTEEIKDLKSASRDVDKLRKQVIDLYEKQSSLSNEISLKTVDQKDLRYFYYKIRRLEDRFERLEEILHEVSPGLSQEKIPLEVPRDDRK